MLTPHTTALLKTSETTPHTHQQRKMQQLARPHSVAGPQLRPAGACFRPSLRSRTVVCAEGPSGKPVREFREDTGEVSVPGEKQAPSSSGAPLYADQVAQVSPHSWRTGGAADDGTTERGVVMMCGGHPQSRAGQHASISHLTPHTSPPAGQAEGKYLKGDEAAAKEGVLRPGRCREHGEYAGAADAVVECASTTPASCCWVQLTNT